MGKEKKSEREAIQIEGGKRNQRERKVQIESNKKFFFFFLIFILVVEYATKMLCGRIIQEFDFPKIKWIKFNDFIKEIGSKVFAGKFYCYCVHS